MRRWFEECNKGKTAFMAVFDELHAADIVAHGGTGEEVRGLKNFKEYCLEWLNAFPDLHFTVDDIVVEGDRSRSEVHGPAPLDTSSKASRLPIKK
jgi:hypothetical protein